MPCDRAIETGRQQKARRCTYPDSKGQGAGASAGAVLCAEEQTTVPRGTGAESFMLTSSATVTYVNFSKPNDGKGEEVMKNDGRMIAGKVSVVQVLMKGIEKSPDFVHLLFSVVRA